MIARRKRLQRNQTRCRRSNRGRRAASFSASNSQALTYHKGAAHTRTQAQLDRQGADALRCARVKAVLRDAGCRADCGWHGPWDRLERHEEPPRSAGGWKQLVRSCDVVAIRRRLVMLCPACHTARHPGPYMTVKLRVRVLDRALGTDGPLEFSEGGKVWVTTRPLF